MTRIALAALGVALLTLTANPAHAEEGNGCQYHRLEAALGLFLGETTALATTFLAPAVAVSQDSSNSLHYWSGAGYTFLGSSVGALGPAFVSGGGCSNEATWVPSFAALASGILTTAIWATLSTPSKSAAKRSPMTFLVAPTTANRGAIATLSVRF